MAEASDERLFQELIGAEAEAPAFHFGGLADFPAVVVDGGEVADLSQAHGVEVARLGLEERGAAFAAGFLESADARAVGAVAREGAVGAVDDGGDQVAFLVNVCDIALAEGLAGGGE